MAEQEQLQAFPPLLGKRPTCLVLGSMPSVVSLQQQQYYAHPRNAFWPIMGSVFGFDAQAAYPARVKNLVANGVAVWDVLQSCQRSGSLDSAIQRDSEIANDFDNLFMQQTSIKQVFFNGQAATKIFNRHCSEIIKNFQSIGWQTLPSTSPAYASKSFEEKRQIWQQHLLSNK